MTGFSNPLTSNSLSSNPLLDYLLSLSDSDMRELITCRVSSKPLTTAVRLKPCNDKVNESVAVPIFLEIVNGTRNPHYKICPSCKHAVTGFESDLKTRIFVKWILENRFNSVLPHRIEIEEPGQFELEEKKSEPNTTKSEPTIQ